jgi:hypothetical protein
VRSPACTWRLRRHRPAHAPYQRRGERLDPRSYEWYYLKTPVLRNSGEIPTKGRAAMKKPKLKVTTIKIDESLHAALPELSRAHNNESFSGIVRKLLWQEIARLGLMFVEPGPKAKSHRRATT